MREFELCVYLYTRSLHCCRFFSPCRRRLDVSALFESNKISQKVKEEECITWESSLRSALILFCQSNMQTSSCLFYPAAAHCVLDEKGWKKWDDRWCAGQRRFFFTKWSHSIHLECVGESRIIERSKSRIWKESTSRTDCANEAPAKTGDLGLPQFRARWRRQKTIAKEIGYFVKKQQPAVSH